MPFLGLGVQLGHTLPPSGGGGAYSNTYSLSLDGTDDYAEVTGLGLSGATSFSAWFNPQASASYYPILHSDPSGIYILFIGGALYVYLYDNTNGGYLTKNYTLNQSIGDWHHIVVTVDATSNLSALKLYIDGSEVSAGNAGKSGTYNSFNVPSTNPLDIGARTSGNIYAQQLMDEVAIFGSELSASDVTAIYNSGVPDDLSSYSPVGWWRMGDTGTDFGTTTITDAGSGGNNASLENGATFSTNVPT